MNTKIQILNEEELFRVNYLVKSFGMSEEFILARLTSNHVANVRRFEQFDASASMMFDCLVDSHNAYMASKRKLPYQVWNSFREEFLTWLKHRPDIVNVRMMLIEIVLCNEDYKNYFKTYKPLWKFINRMIEEHNEFYKEVSHV